MKLLVSAIYTAALQTLFLFSDAAASINPADALKEADAVRSSDPVRFETLISQLEDARATLSNDELYYLDYLKAYKMSRLGQFEDALKVYENISKNSANKNLAYRAQSSIVNTHAVKRDYYNGSLAILYLNELRKFVTDKDLLYHGYGTSGTFFNQTGQYKEAKEQASKLIIGGTSNRLVCAGHQIDIEAQYYIDPNELDGKYIDNSIDFCRSIDEVLIASVIAIFKAKVLTNSGEHEKSLTYLKENKDYILSSSYHWATSQFFLTSAQNALLLGRVSEADNLAMQGLDATEILGHAKPKVEIYELLSSLAESKDDYQAALSYKKLHAEAEKAYLNETKLREFAIQQVKYETEEKLNQINLLDKENALLRTQNELAEEQSQNNRLALALACTLMVLLFFWVYRSRRLQVQLRRLAEVDDLTGICNRHHFNTQAAQTLNLAKQTKQPVSFVLFDLDHFKKVNDTYGHQTGDWVLKKAVDSAKTVCRSNDIIGRMGGEEFAILLPGCTIDKATEIAEMCRKKIEAVDTIETGESFTISASFGVSDNYHCTHQLEKLFAGADTALYEAKQAGRNQIKTYHEDQEPVPV